MTRSHSTIAQAQRFLIVSGIGISIDASVYLILSEQFAIDASWAKRISFVCIMFWGFFAHKHFTFGRKALCLYEPIRFMANYAIGFALNSFVHDAMARSADSSIIAFLTATAAWALWNFFGQKYFVFRTSGNLEKSDDVSA